MMKQQQHIFVEEGTCQAETGRTWVVLSKSNDENRRQLVHTERAPDGNLSIAPMPTIKDPRTRGRIPYQAWQYIYSDDIEDTVDELYEVLTTHLGGAEDCPHNLCIGPHFRDDARYWLYLNSSSSLRSSSEHFRSPVQWPRH